MGEPFAIWKDSAFIDTPNFFTHKFVFVSLIFTLVSLGILWIQYNNVPALSTLRDYIQIKNNIGNWVENVTDAQDTERSRNNGLLLQVGVSLYDWECFDAGGYYIPLRLNKNGLQESIRRGAGDAWKVQKNNMYDPAAFQFCNYVINNRSNEIITCGIDAFEKSGTSGLFETTHWCTVDWNNYVASKRRF